MTDPSEGPVSAKHDGSPVTEKGVVRLHRRVQKLVKKRKVNEASSLVEAALRDHPDSWPITQLLGSTYEQLQDYAKAQEAYVQALRIVPESSITHLSLGDLLFRMGRFDEALLHFMKCTSAWPDSSSAHSSVGLALLRLGKVDEAEPLLQRAIDLSHFNPDARSGMAEVYTRTGRRDLIGDLYQAYIAEAPNLASSHAFMADHLFFNLGDAVGSLPYYEKALSLGHRMKDVGWFRQYISTDYYMGEVVDSYLSALHTSGYDDLARRVARDECDRAQFQVWMSMRLEEEGDTEAAEGRLARALEVQPNAASWRYQLGRLRLLRMDFLAAEREFRLAIDQAEAHLTQDVWYSVGLALTLKNQGRLEESAPILGNAMESDKERAHKALMSLHADLGNWEASLEAALEAMESDPEDGYTLEHAARAYSNLDRLDDSLATYQRLIELQPRNGKARLALAALLVENGRRGEALSTLDQALESGSLSRPQQAKAKELRADALSSAKTTSQ